MKEIYDKVNDSLTKSKNQASNETRKRLYNSFGGNEKTKSKSNSSSINKIHNIKALINKYEKIDKNKFCFVFIFSIT